MVDIFRLKLVATCDGHGTPTPQTLADPNGDYVSYDDHCFVVDRLRAQLTSARKQAFEEAAQIAEDPYQHVKQEWPTIDQICESVAAALRQRGESE